MSQRDPSSSPAQHRAEGPKSVPCAVVTVSDTRGEGEDKSGRFILDALKAAGHASVFFKIVKDEPEEIREALRGAREAGARVALVNGGTGIARRDQTHETIAALLEKKLDGFGEIFRMLSYEEIGAAAMLSRAVAGTVGGMAVFSMPGSTGAVRLAMEKLILPELGHIVRELEK